MKVMQDTNVLASAVATRGLCADVLREVLAEHELLVCPQTLSELQRTLLDKFAAPRQLVNDFVRLVRRDSVHCEPGRIPAIKFKDKDDLGILAAAVGGGADALVTGDKELQSVGAVEGVKIMSPRQFWEAIKGDLLP
jgi:putative PIN family toxin of toxin-antitoxin system